MLDSDRARLGQMLASDLLVIPTVKRLEYVAHSRDLKNTDRRLTYYAGGVEIAFKTVNVVTGELIHSETLSREFPTTEPSTRDVAINGAATSDRAISDLTEAAAQNLVVRAFPISVVGAEGQEVILSQGGLQPGVIYRVVQLGDVIADPSTQAPIGRSERDAGMIRITRGEATLSYGTIEGGQPAASMTSGKFQLRETLMPAQAVPKKVVAAKSSSQGEDPSATTTNTAVVDGLKVPDKDW